MNQTYILLELAIANNDLDLFFQGSGIYSFSDNIFYPVRRSVMADEAMNIIYSYYGETLNQSIVEKVENVFMSYCHTGPEKVFIRHLKFWQV